MPIQHAHTTADCVEARSPSCETREGGKPPAAAVLRVNSYASRGCWLNAAVLPGVSDSLVRI
jgi:hypothetical protein